MSTISPNNEYELIKWGQIDQLDEYKLTKWEPIDQNENELT